MADQTREDIAAKAKADAAPAKVDPAPKLDFKAEPAPAPAQPAASDPRTLATMVETMQAMQRRIAPLAAAGATPDLDVTQPGGFYIVKGVKVNAHGRELNDDGSIKYPDQQRVNEFGQLV